MLGSPIQNNNLMNLLFSAHAQGAGTEAAHSAKQKEFLHFLSVVKEAIHHDQNRQERPLEKIGIQQDKKLSNTQKTEKTTSQSESIKAEDTPVREEFHQDEVEGKNKAELEKDPKKAIGEILSQLIETLQGWRPELGQPEALAEGELPEELHALLQEIQALQASLEKQPEEAVSANALEWLSQILVQVVPVPKAEEQTDSSPEMILLERVEPEALLTSDETLPTLALPENTPLEAIEQPNVKLEGTIVQQQAASETLAAVQKLSETAPVLTHAGKLSKALETLEKSPETAQMLAPSEKLPETVEMLETLPEAQAQKFDKKGAPSSATLDSVKLEKLMVKIANIMESAPEETKTALEDVVNKVRSLADILAGQPKGKSIQQMQFEAMMGSPKSPELESIAESPAPLQGHLLSVLETASNQSVFSGAISSVSAGNAIVTPGAGIQAADNNPISAPHTQVVDAAKMTIQAGKKEISIKLMPSELGEVRMTLNSNAQNQVSARLVTETPEAKQALEKNLEQLVRSLEASGLKIGKIQIVQAGEAADNSSFTGDNNQNQDTSLSQQQRQQQQQQQAFSFNASANGNSGSFTDGGSSQAGDEASSSQSFDTDVEGEEVLASTDENPVIRDDGSVDVKI